LIELLDAMRERTPDHPVDGVLRAISGPVPAVNPGTGAPWSTSARVRVRALNVLNRWAAVQNDPRLTWVDPLAPLGNLRLVAATLAQLWRYNAEPEVDAGLTEDDLDEIWMTWIRAFVGTGSGDGWLNHSRLPDDEIRARLGGDFARNATVLCWLALRPRPGRRERIVEWQPVLRAILDWGLLEVDEDTADYLAATGRPVSADQVETDLLEALEFIDDDLWCSKTASGLGLTDLGLKAVTHGHRTSIRLFVGGVQDPLNDPRLPVLVVAVGRYRSTETVTIFGADPDWRLAIIPGEPVYFMGSRSDNSVESAPLEADTIENLASTNGVLANLFAAAARTA
jgi:hypothetical protein